MKLVSALATITCLSLVGCSSTGRLQPQNPDEKISGIVERGAFEPYKVQVAFDGKTYRGEWKSQPPTEDQQAATRGRLRKRKIKHAKA